MQLFTHRWGQQLPGQNQKKIVLLHGLCGVGALWRPVAARLEESYEILAPDQRGHGASPVPTGETFSFSPLDYGRDVIETLEAKSFFPAWILGHSMGVRSAVAAAFLKPEWVSGLILIDLGFSGLAGGGLGERLGGFLTQLEQARPFISQKALQEFLTQYAPDPGMAKYLFAGARLQAHPEQFNYLSFPGMQATLRQASEAAPLKQWLQALSKAPFDKPILALRGEQSTVWSRSDFEQEKKFFQNSSVEFEECQGVGHGLPFEALPWLVHQIKKKLN